ncbi:MAG: hypothetical protein IT245_05750, partial [Bacteroidia bacterium]|nr:hypothetical protein [Bacteroidia bacterium]
MSVFFFVLIDKYRKNIKIKQNEALNNLIVGQEIERERLARDLHDEMGPQLSNILLNIDAIKVENQTLMQLVSDTKAELKYAINDIRKISHDLMSQSLKRYGLVAAIEELIDRQPIGSIQVEFFSNSKGLEYNDNIKSHLFKITQELVYNSNKYSESDKINIQLIIDEKLRTIAYSYKDNGKGNPDFKPDNAGLGLK